MGSRQKTLRQAVSSHSVKGVAEAIQRGEDVNSVARGFSLLAEAGRLGGTKNDLAIAHLLLDNGADPNGRGVMVHCRMELLPRLLAAGAHVDGNSDEENPLLYAIIARTKQDKALALIEAGANVNVRDMEGQTPLIAAARYARAKTAARLLTAGADPFVTDATGRTPLRCAIEGLAGNSLTSERSAYASIFRILRDGAPAQPEDLVLTALAAGDLSEVGRMLDEGLDANASIRGMIGHVGISTDTFLKSVGGLAEMLEDGVDRSALDDLAGGATILMWAVALQQPELVRLLLQRGADPNRRNADGISAADLSVRFPHMKVKELLGTAGVSFHSYEAGKRIFSPGEGGDLRAEQLSTRAERLGVVKGALQICSEGADRTIQQYASAPAGDKRQTSEYCIEALWKAASVAHVREEAELLQQALKETLRWSEGFFFGPAGGIPDTCEERWTVAFPCALAAAVTLGQDAAVAKLAGWVTPERPRGPRSPLYNEHYFVWPLYQVWARQLRGDAPDPRFERMIHDESATWPKRLLEAWTGVASDDPTLAGRAFGRCIKAHRKKASVNGSTWPERVLSPEICFIVAWAGRQGRPVIIPRELVEWVAVSTES